MTTHLYSRIENSQELAARKKREQRDKTTEQKPMQPKIEEEKKSRKLSRLIINVDNEKRCVRVCCVSVVSECDG